LGLVCRIQSQLIKEEKANPNNDAKKRKISQVEASSFYRE
jgi:hypothetical protein